MQTIKIGEFLLNTELSTLYKGSQEFSIEPKLLELLLLFCNKPNQVVSREDILISIWNNAIVTDNAINKMIANLRKLLCDSPKTPKYIQTVPKRGYRLICAVEIIQTNEAQDIEDDITDHASVKMKKSPSPSFELWKIALLVVFIILTLYFAVDLSKAPPNLNKTQELTRQQGREFSAIHLNNNNTLLYLKKDNKTHVNQLWRKDLSSNQQQMLVVPQIRIIKLIATTMVRGKKEQQLLLMGIKDKQCHIFQLALSSGKQLDEYQSIFSCDDMLIRDIDYRQSTQGFIYTASKAGQQSLKIYQYDSATKKHVLMTQPNPIDIGNHNIDISPDGKKLLIMRSNADLHTQLFVLNMVNSEITAHQKFGYYVAEAIWHHDSEHILYFPPPPSHQVIMSSLSGDKKSTIINTSEYLSRDISRIDDGINILFATNTSNYSNHWLIGDMDNSLLDNSSVYDMLPTLLHHSTEYLFVSKRSGKSQLYLGNYTTGETQIISQLDNYLVFRHLDISANDQQILIATRNRVWLLPLQQLISGDITLNKLDQYQVFHTKGVLRAVSWLSNSTIAISNQLNNQLTVNLIDTVSKQVSSLDNRWHYAVSATSNGNDIILIGDDDNSLYKTTLAWLTKSANANFRHHEPLGLNKKIDKYISYPKFFQNKLYFVSFANGKVSLKSVSIDQKQIDTEYQIDRSYGYDISSVGILLNERKSNNGDIHRTVQ